MYYAFVSNVHTITVDLFIFSHVKWEITEMPLLYAAATASHQMQVYIVGSLQFSKCLCGKWIVLFMRRRLSHYICGVLQCDVEFFSGNPVCRKEVETLFIWVRVSFLWLFTILHSEINEENWFTCLNATTTGYADGKPKCRFAAWFQITVTHSW